MKNNLLHLVGLALVTLSATVSGWGFAYITNDNTGLPLKWPAGTVAIQIKLGGTATLSDGTNFSTSAQGAMQQWNLQLGNLQLSPTIVPESPADDRNNINEMVFARDVFGKAFDTNTIAVTTVWSRGNERTRGDIVFNSNRTWDSYDGPSRGSSGAIDLQRVALHELGHLLGLDHPDEAGQTIPAIMNSRVGNLDSLASDDITAAQNLYGPPGVPANDNFNDASLIVLAANNSASVKGYTTNATKQAGEPNHAGNAGGHSIWWRWTAPAGGPVSLDTRGSYADTTLAVYTGTSLSSLTTIASNDDINQGVVQASSLTFSATAGTTYYFAVDGWDGDTAGITLNLSFNPSGPLLPVITAQPASATVTSGGSASFSVTATGATGYQWTFNGSNISGATGTTYTISSVTSANAGSYRVVVSNAAGSLNSEIATLTVNAPPAPPAPPPSSGGGGGGGAPSFWFYGALSLLALARLVQRRRCKA